MLLLRGIDLHTPQWAGSQQSGRSEICRSFFETEFLETRRGSRLGLSVDVISVTVVRRARTLIGEFSTTFPIPISVFKRCTPLVMGALEGSRGNAHVKVLRLWMQWYDCFARPCLLQLTVWPRPNQQRSTLANVNKNPVRLHAQHLQVMLSMVALSMFDVRHAFAPAVRLHCKPTAIASSKVVSVLNIHLVVAMSLFTPVHNCVIS